MNSVASLCRKLKPGQETSPVQTCSLLHHSLDTLWLNLFPMLDEKSKSAKRTKSSGFAFRGPATSRSLAAEAGIQIQICPSGMSWLLWGAQVTQGWRIWGTLWCSKGDSSSPYGSQASCKFHNVYFLQEHPELLWRFPERLKFTFIFCPVLK